MSHPQRSSPAAAEPAMPTGSDAPSPSSATAPYDYRDQLFSRRWDAAPLRNPEVEKSDPRIVVLAIAILSAITLIAIVAGYSSGFWG